MNGDFGESSERKETVPDTSSLTPAPGPPGGALTGARAMSPLLFGILFLVVVFIAYQFVGSLLTAVFIGTSITAENANAMRVATLVAQLVFLALPALLAVKLRGGNAVRALRLHAVRPGPAFLVVLSVVGLQFAMQGYMTLQDHVLREYLLPDALMKIYDAVEKLISQAYVSLLAMRSPLELALVWLVAALTPAVCEELVFRGVAQRAFEQGLRARWALLLSAGIFSLFHLYPMQFIALGSIGIFLGFVVWRGNSLYYGMIGHITNNTMSVLSIYYFGPEKATQEVAAGGDEVALLALAGCIALGACLYAFWRATQPATSITTA